jgi:hypothetical protein
MLRSLALVLFSVALIFFARHRESATTVKESSTSHFSAEDAMDYLKVIAAETHPIGSIANNKVRDYIVDELSRLGLETSIESGYIDFSWGGRYSRSAYVENIIAVLPGSDPNGKKVVLAAHYDSVFEGPGAADDGYAVAAMMQTVKLLKSQARKNDIQLIITDGEEMGLLGARYHVEHNDMSDVGILLNYEARGNQGPCNSFEWSDNNAWLVREMKKVSIRPIASSLSYEIYKRMPNSSDFTAFANKNIPGINHAFIDGFAYYHNPADNIENISMNSIQHTGENMYLMAEHFSNYDFSNVEKGNASFFNFYGLLINYPSGIDLILLILLGIIFLSIIFAGRKVDGFNFLNIGKAFLLILITIVFIGFANFLLGLAAKSFYPQYSTFYIHQYYNHEWYFLGGLGLSIFLLAIISRWLVSPVVRFSFGFSLFLVMSIVSVVLYVLMPTGVYVMLIPALGVGILILIDLLAKNVDRESWLPSLLYLFCLIGLWTFLSHGLFLAFNFEALPGAVLFAILATMSSMYLLPSVWNPQGKKIIMISGFLLFVFSIVVAHVKTTPSEQEPLLTNIKYVYDSENDKSYVATFDDYIHEGHLSLLDNSTKGRLPNNLTYSTFYKEHESNVDSLKSTIVSDTTNNHAYKIKHPKRASIAYVCLPKNSNVDSVFIDNRFSKNLSTKDNKLKFLTLYGYGLDSLNIRVTKLNDNQPAQMYVNMEYQGLSEDLTPNEGIAWNDPISYVSHLIQTD